MEIILNKNILKYYEQLKQVFENDIKYLPARVAFIIIKNKLLLNQLSEEIYDMKNQIIKKYGTLKDENEEIYNIPSELLQSAQKELDDLLEVEQNIHILKLKFSDIENLEFTFNQMEAIMFMIEEDNNEDQVE